MEQFCILMLLGVNSWTDICKKEVSLLTIGIFGILGFVKAYFCKNLCMGWIASASIGMMVIVISLISDGAVGMGDGFLLLALGTLLSFEELLETFLLGLLFCGFCGIILLLLPGNGKKKEVPFVPFLLLGYIGGLIY